MPSDAPSLGSSPHYDKPPVVEVLCGMRFAAVKNFRSVDVGLFTAEMQNEFPHVEEHAPINDREGIMLANIPDIRRTWLLSEDKTYVLQIQADRFLFSWRKVQDGQQYPRYPGIVQRFKQLWNRFRDWMQARGFGPLDEQGLELTYVNHVIPDNGFDYGRTHEVVSFFNRVDGAILKNPRTMSGELRFELPYKQQAGELLVSLKQRAKMDESPVLVIEMRAKSAVAHDFEWFTFAHHWIVFGFADITTEHVRRDCWGYKEP